MTPLELLLIGLVVLGLIVFWYWPSKGGKSMFRRLLQRRKRILIEDLLKHMLKSRIQSPSKNTLVALAGALNIKKVRLSKIIDEAVEQKLITWNKDQLQLTEKGREVALLLLRAHRLWEHYLAEQTGHEPVEWHGLAEAREHSLSKDEIVELEKSLGFPARDPHGDPIPDKDGRSTWNYGTKLLTLEPGEKGYIIHVEDEPEETYKNLYEKGVTPESDIKILSSDDNTLTVEVEGTQQSLTKFESGNIYVEKSRERMEDGGKEEENRLTLLDLKSGETGVVDELSKQIKGAERRRLFDLGFIPGTEVTCQLSNPLNDPHGYLVRGATIALRNRQARAIKIRKPEKESVEI